MSTTNVRLEEDNDEPTDCEHDWCSGLTSETLPCFSCFNPTRDYATTRRSIREATQRTSDPAGRTAETEEEV